MTEINLAASWITEDEVLILKIWWILGLIKTVKEINDFKTLKYKTLSLRFKGEC